MMASSEIQILFLENTKQYFIEIPTAENWEFSHHRHSRNMEGLPKKLLEKIGGYLSFDDLLAFSQTSSTLTSIRPDFVTRLATIITPDQWIFNLNLFRKPVEISVHLPNSNIVAKWTKIGSMKEKGWSYNGYSKASITATINTCYEPGSGGELRMYGLQLEDEEEVIITVVFSRA